MSDTSLTKCKHCGLALKGEPNNWLHAEGKQRGKRRCAVEPYGFNGEAPGEDCSHICLGSRPMLPEGSGIPNEPFFIYPAEGGPAPCLMPALSDAPNERNTMHELTEVIHNHYPPYCRESCDVPSYVGGWAEHVAAAVQAELVRASTVTTEAELNALPEGTLIESGTFILRHRRRIKQWQQVMRTDGEPCHPYDMEPADVPVPATVLFRPV